MITLSQEYALRLILHLSWSEYTRAYVAARKAHCPAGYASKILQTLEKSGYLVSQRGRRGGYKRRMGRHPTVGQVINCFGKPALRPLDCLFFDEQAMNWSLADLRAFVKANKKTFSDWGSL